MKRTGFFFKTAAGLLALLCASVIAADTVSIRLVYVGDPGNSAFLGAQQGLSEANLQGQFLNQKYDLDSIPAAEALTTDYTPYLAVVAAVDHDAYHKLLDQLHNIPVFNVTLDDDDLRAACLTNALHVVPSRQMKQDAVAQWLKKNPEAKVTAQTWRPDFVKFAARDLNKRFTKNFKQPMDDNAWAGWAAVKMTSDTIARENITAPVKLLDYLKTSLLFDGQMGVEMNFRPTGQLRQPLLLIENGKIAGEAPVRGVADPTDLDSLGNVECAK
ncbi:MAG: ABC transporter substrate-binding protein [Gammaproteobacteria bacterium]